MGNHIDTRNQQRKLKEHDDAARRRRTSFKQYLRQIEEELLEADDDLAEDEVTPTKDEDQDE